ncbi:MAG: hypothetical protein K2N84_04475 [Clostridia bacterium]|nr:hypothetical protein [Clostridia bacterium]MDE7296502.1 hypothetical protein [Clostridia bacterium]
MKDFASYEGKGKQKKTADDWMREAKAVAGQYDGKSEGDMMKEIFSRAMEGKRNGTLTNEQIDAFYKQFAPMLDGVKRKKLQKLVEQLKKT